MYEAGGGVCEREGIIELHLRAGEKVRGRRKKISPFFFFLVEEELRVSAPSSSSSLPKSIVFFYKCEQKEEPKRRSQKTSSAVPQRYPARRGVAQRPDLDDARGRKSLARPAAAALVLPGPSFLLLPRRPHRDLERPGLRRGVRNPRQLRLDLLRRHRRPPHRRGKGGAGGSLVVVFLFVFVFVAVIVDEAGDQEVPRAVGEAKRRQRGRDLEGGEGIERGRD